MELIERGPALQVLRSAYAIAEEGAGRTALVFGEAGIGKTTLLKELVAGLRGGRVLWGGCEALFSPRPLGPLHDMADALGPNFKTVLGLEGGRVELFTSLFANLQESPGITVIVFEDLHWADEATLDLVKFLARRIQRVRALIVLSYRDDELGERHPLQMVLGDLPAEAVVRVPLLPLSENGVAELARQARHSAEGIYAATGGNPFFVTEALRAEGVPATVRDAVLSRAARQTPAVRAVLDLAAIVPARIESDLMDAVLAPDPSDVAAALASGLLIAYGRTYAFRHELARITLEQALPVPLAAALHARVLACLEQRAQPVPTSRLVHHASGAGDSTAVLKYALHAGDEAASHGAHHEAASLYATTLVHAEAMAPAEKASLLDRLSYQSYLIERNDDAITARTAALAIWRSLGDRHEEGRTLRWLSRLYWRGGYRDTAEDYANQCVQLMEELPDDEGYAWALSNRSQLYMLSDDTDEAVEWGTRAIDLATRINSQEVLAHALNNVGTARYVAGLCGGKAMLERSLEISLSYGYVEHVARCYANLVSAAVKARDYVEARKQITEATRYFTARDLDMWTNYNEVWEARADFEQGEWESAATTTRRLVGSRGVAPVTRMCALATLARLHMRRGDSGGEQLLTEAVVLARASGELQRLAPVAAALGEQAWLQDVAPDPLVLHIFTMAEQLRDPRSRGELRYWCHKLGLIEAVPEGVETPYALQFAGRWREAAQAWDVLGCAYERALALLEGDEAAMREALAILEALGATATVRRCREHLRGAGVRGLPRGPRATTSANPAGLTAREYQVFTLVAQGLSNAQIASALVRSEKTVDHHISAILRKLDARSRGEAVANAGRMGIVAKHGTDAARG